MKAWVIYRGRVIILQSAFLLQQNITCIIDKTHLINLNYFSSSRFFISQLEEKQQNRGRYRFKGENPGDIAQTKPKITQK